MTRQMLRVFFAFMVVCFMTGFVFATAGQGNVDGNDQSLAALVPMACYLLLALGVSFLCSVLEAVLLSVGPGQVQIMVEAGQKSGFLLKALRQNLDRSLSAILTLNTIAHTVGAAGVGAEVARVFGDRYLAAASAILTFLVLVLSEIIPKTLGARYARVLAGKSAILIHWLSRVLWPLVALLHAFSRWLFGDVAQSQYSRRELIAIAGLAGQEGELEDAEAGMVQNLLRLKTMPIREMMTPSTVVFSLAGDLTVAGTIAKYAPIEFSRIPIHGEDGRLGHYMMYTDLLESHQTGKDEERLINLALPLVSVMDSTNVYTALQRLTENRSQILLVVNEFGEAIGIVTGEDVLESIVGKPITDEDDKHTNLREHALRIWKASQEERE